MTSFRVLQFNMQFGQGWRTTDPDHAPIDLAKTIAEISRIDADIVMLQEVEHAQPGGGQAEPPPNFSKIREALPHYFGAFGYPKADPRELPFGIGLAILSKQPVTDIRRVDLPSPPIPFEFGGAKMTPTDRVLLGATTFAADRQLRLLNTHLLAFFMLGSTSKEHPGQINRVGEELAKSAGPTILTGDFNVSHHENLIDAFAPLGFATAQSAETTWRRRPYILDHIFYNAPLKCISRSVVPTEASDHHMLVGEFEFA